MASSPFQFLVMIRTFPLPEGVLRYHYFRTKKAAVNFYNRTPYLCDIKCLCHGATLLKPVVLATLEYRGQLYDCRREFDYEEEPDDVNAVWVDHDVLGCDCTRSDMISMCCEGQFPHLGHGSKIALHKSVVVYECASAEFILH